VGAENRTNMMSRPSGSMTRWGIWPDHCGSRSTFCLGSARCAKLDRSLWNICRRWQSRTSSGIHTPRYLRREESHGCE